MAFVMMRDMARDYDVIVVGSGAGGDQTSSTARRRTTTPKSPRSSARRDWRSATCPAARLRCRGMIRAARRTSGTSG